MQPSDGSPNKKRVETPHLLRGQLVKLILSNEQIPTEKNMDGQHCLANWYKQVCLKSEYAQV